MQIFPHLHVQEFVHVLEWGLAARRVSVLEVSTLTDILRDRRIRSHAVQGTSGEQRRSMNTNTTASLKLRGATLLLLSPWAATIASRKFKKKTKREKKKVQLKLFLSSPSHISDSQNLWSMCLNLPWNWPWEKVLLLERSLSLTPDIKCMRFFHYDVSQKVQQANDARER